MPAAAGTPERRGKWASVVCSRREIRSCGVIAREPRSLRRQGPVSRPAGCPFFAISGCGTLRQHECHVDPCPARAAQWVPASAGTQPVEFLARGVDAKFRPPLGVARHALRATDTAQEACAGRALWLVWPTWRTSAVTLLRDFGTACTCRRPRIAFLCVFPKPPHRGGFRVSRVCECRCRRWWSGLQPRR